MPITANILNIQPFSIHDGPGIRTTVFLKGCSLNCLWCHNPESQLKTLELLFDADKCAGCGLCVAVCPNNAISLKDGRSWTDRNRCDGHGACVAVCPNGAREIAGEAKELDVVFDKIMEDNIFFRQSEGGVTISGGEPMQQAKFVAALLSRCKAAGLHTAVDTCGYAKWEIIEQVLEYTDLVLYDIKHMDSVQHKQLTGVPNELILENAKKICHQAGKEMQVRTSMVPGYNDSDETIQATATFIAMELSPSIAYHLLPYHCFGEAKQRKLEWGGDRLFTAAVPTDEHVVKLQRIAESTGLSVFIGG